jgi:hypothetical protein
VPELTRRAFLAGLAAVLVPAVLAAGRTLKPAAAVESGDVYGDIYGDIYGSRQTSQTTRRRGRPK